MTDVLPLSSVNLDGSGSVTNPTVKMVRLYNSCISSQILENISNVSKYIKNTNTN